LRGRWDRCGGLLAVSLQDMSRGNQAERPGGDSACGDAGSACLHEASPHFGSQEMDIELANQSESFAGVGLSVEHSANRVMLLNGQEPLDQNGKTGRLASINSGTPMAADSQVDLSVVVPLYNEEESVPELLRRLDETLGPLHELGTSQVAHRAESCVLVDHELQGGELHGGVQQAGLRCQIVLVDDGSRDSTYRVGLQQGQRVSVPVKMVSLQRNFGQTAAMQAGIDAADGELIATMDGDLQNDPADLPMMVDHFRREGLDLLCGRRKKRQDGMFLRLIPSWIANRLIARVTGVTISDNGCSLKVYRGSIIRQVRLMGEMHRFIPAWVSQVTHPSKIGEVDVRHHARQFGESKYGISRTIRVVLDLMAVLFFMRFRARPGHFFGIVGMAIGAVGALMLGSLFITKYGFGEDIGSRPMLIIGALAMLSSVQFICFGIMAEMLTRIYHESGGRNSYVVREMSTVSTKNELAAESIAMRQAG